MIVIVLCVTDMSVVPNPYEPPSLVDTESPGTGERTHEWQGRTISVSSHAAAGILWLDNVITVTVDNKEAFQQKVFQAGSSFRFKFPNDGRLVETRVKRAWGFFVRRIRYELIIDDQIVANAQTPVAKWERGLAVMLAVNVGILVWLGSYFLL